MTDNADKIDEVSFAQGREAFDRGTSLRTVIEAVKASDKGSAADEAMALSFALGFADALIDRLRK